MQLEVIIEKASENRLCHWCKAGFIYVADQALGTGKTILCEFHTNEFMTKYRAPEPELPKKAKPEAKSVSVINEETHEEPADGQRDSRDS
jgi:hypothetical protein